MMKSKHVKHPKQGLKHINKKIIITSNLLGFYMFRKHAFSSRLQSDPLHISKDQQASLKSTPKSQKKTRKEIERSRY